MRTLKEVEELSELYYGIIKEIAEELGLAEEKVLRNKNLAIYRYGAMSLLYDMTKSYPTVSAATRKQRGTVMFGVDKYNYWVANGMNTEITNPIEKVLSRHRNNK